MALDWVEAQGIGIRKVITAYVMPCSAASATGENLSRSATNKGLRNASPTPPSPCPRWTPTCQPKTETTPGPRGWEDWPVFRGDAMETNTMPGWAGSSWYFLRYMDPHNDAAFCSRDKSDYWGQVDLYVGGAEHNGTPSVLRFGPNSFSIVDTLASTNCSSS